MIDDKGWFHTGDLGTMSADGHVFINGRIKNMLLGANGQNIYPEEIENRLNSMAMVSESIIIQKDNQLPVYCRISHIVLHEEEFEKTPKKSIKRYLYQEGVRA